MSALIRTTPDLYLALLDEGFELPEECSNVQLMMPAAGIIQLHYEVNVTGEDLVKLGRALNKLGEQSRTWS